VKFCVAFGRVPFEAVRVMGYVPPDEAPGVPLRVPVPLPLLVRVTPDGSVPVSEMVAAGKPVVETVKVAAVPAVNVTLEADVMVGAWFTLTEVRGLSVPLHSDSLGVTV
jgi:hypothetical protein